MFPPLVVFRWLPRPWAFFLLAGVLIACGSAPRSPAGAGPQAPPPVPFVPSAELELARGPVAGNVPVPVEPDDPQWGSPQARVTLVAFLDLECPFCSRAEAVIDNLERRFGPQDLRIVFKHYPLEFHPHAEEAARSARAVQELRGPQAFFVYVRALFEAQGALGPDTYAAAAGRVGIAPNELQVKMGSPSVIQAIARDLALGRRLGVTGTPHFFLNGARLEGLVPEDDLARVIDLERSRANELLARGAPPAQIYGLRSAENFRTTEPEEEPEDEAVWAVPVGNAPQLGPPGALVTLIEFSDFECPYCKRVQPTLLELRKRYGDDLRLVFRHQPLPFHAHARAAATFSIEARAQKGDVGFWQAVDGLFAASPRLDEPVLLGLGKSMGLDARRLRTALKSLTHDDALLEDEAVAADFDVSGTPHFFINGRRIVGAQPLERFVEIVDLELGKARALVAERHLDPAHVYDEILRGGSGPPPPERREVPPPGPGNPTHGPANAPVVVQMFGDLQCPFCRRARGTLAELEKRHPGKIRIVFRHLPLEMHPAARAAAAAAEEAFVQRGSDAFWKMVDLIEAELDNQTPLTRADLLEHAITLKLDLSRFSKALDDGRHEAVIQADENAARAAGFHGTPAFVIDGYVLEGAQPLGVFERIVTKALAENR